MLFHGAKRESDDERRALTFVAVDVDRAPVLLDHLPRAGQADPLAGEPADDIGRAMVALENARQVGGRDADAAVAGDVAGEPIAGRLGEDCWRGLPNERGSGHGRSQVTRKLTF